MSSGVVLTIVALALALVIAGLFRLLGVLDSAELCGMWEDLCSRYPIVSLEDGEIRFGYGDSSSRYGDTRCIVIRSVSSGALSG